MKRYTLINAEEQAKKYPDTFEIPTLQERSALKPGQHAKLIFQPDLQGVRAERMWVLIGGRAEGTSYLYEGQLANDPAFIPEEVIKYKDPVQFSPEHIIGILDHEE